MTFTRQRRLRAFSMLYEIKIAGCGVAFRSSRGDCPIASEIRYFLKPYRWNIRVSADEQDTKFVQVSAIKEIRVRIGARGRWFALREIMEVNRLHGHK